MGHKHRWLPVWNQLKSHHMFLKFLWVCIWILICIYDGFHMDIHIYGYLIKIYAAIENEM